MPTQPAVLGSARLNNFRLNYLTAAQAAERPARVWIKIGGIDVTKPTSPTRVIYKSVSIRDALFDAPNTCSLTLYGAAPSIGAPVEVWVDANTPTLLFSGEIQTVDRTYTGRPETVLHPITAIDDTARANRRRPLLRFVNVSATTIAQTLITTYAPGFSAAGVEANLPLVSITFDGSEAGMKGCLTALAKLIGGYWFFENKTLYLFITAPGNPPDPINDTPGRFLHEPHITWSADKSQVRTRVYGKGASSRIVATLDAGTTLVPLENVEMFNAVGGQAIVAAVPDGAAYRVVTYTGVQLGGGGGLVGPGAAPSAAPGLTLADGAGIEPGVHKYAITFMTASGESLPSPTGAITVGPVTPPFWAPNLGAVAAGGAIDIGTYSYAVTFVTPAGETTASPGSTWTTTSVGVGVPTPGATSAALRKVTGNLAVGVAYRYGTTITTGIGETLGGPASAAITPTAPVAPPYVMGTVTPVAGGSVAPGYYRYALGYVVGGYETTIVASQLIQVNATTGVRLNTVPVSADARVTAKRVYRTRANESSGANYYLVAEIANATATYDDMKSDAELGALRANYPNAIGTPPGDQMTVTIPTSTDPRAVGRKIYRSDGFGLWKYLATVSNNTATEYIDNTASVAGNANAPTTDTTAGADYKTIPLNGIMVGPANVTARKLYRDNGSGWRFLTTIANNTQTTYTDTTANAGLGAAGLPVSNTALANRVLVAIATGGSGVTGRKVYRSKANVDPLQLVTTIADNTTATMTDSTADALLGAAPPVTDTSGLAQPSGQVPAGAAAVIVANPAPFPASGGWAVIGNGEQVIRYTGKTATALTGIPPTGPGAVVASISYNSTITAAPVLVGVAGLLDPVIRNSPIHVWVQRDDAAAQAYMVTLDGGGDGVYEHIWSDERRTEGSLIQVCDAQLKLYSRPIVTVTYASRDTKTKSGKTVSIALASPAINASLTIQDVAITELGVAPGLKPKFTVTASSIQHSLDAVLRMLLRKADA